MRSSLKGAQGSAESARNCGCSPERIRAVHVYLKQHFPDYSLRDFHAPTRLMRAGLPMPHAEHHVISITQEGILPYYAVLLGEFQECSAENVGERVRQWRLADTLRAHRIAIVSKDGASPL